MSIIPLFLLEIILTSSRCGLQTRRCVRKAQILHFVGMLFLSYERMTREIDRENEREGERQRKRVGERERER